MAKYQVQVTRTTAVSYLSWEVGTKQNLINELITQTHQNGRVSVRATMFGGDCNSVFRLKRDAESFLRRVREAAAYQMGKIGDGLRAEGEIVRI